jgi:hypothetical protein
LVIPVLALAVLSKCWQHRPSQQAETQQTRCKDSTHHNRLLNGLSPISARLLAPGSRRVGFEPRDSEEMRSLPTGRGSIRVRRRGLPRNRGTDKICGIIAVAIRRLLVVRGSGAWPAKACSPALGLCVSIAPPTEHLRAPPSAQHTQNAQSLPQRREIVRMRSMSASSVRRGQHRCACVPSGARTIV